MCSMQAHLRSRNRGPWSLEFGDWRVGAGCLTEESCLSRAVEVARMKELNLPVPSQKTPGPPKVPPDTAEDPAAVPAEPPAKEAA